MDKADGSGTLLFDLAARDWSAEVLDALGIDRRGCRRPSRGRRSRAGQRRRPRQRPGCPRARRSWPAAATRPRMRSASARSRPGTVALSLGTSGVVFAATDAPLFEPHGRVHAFCHAVPGRWHMMSVMLSRGGQPALVPRRARARASISPTLVAAAADVPAGQRRPVLPAVPVRRAQPASRPAGARRVRRPDARPRPAPHDACRARGRRIRSARRTGADARGRDAARRTRSRRRAAASPARCGARSWPTCWARRSRRPHRRGRRVRCGCAGGGRGGLDGRGRGHRGAWSRPRWQSRARTPRATPRYTPSTASSTRR